MRVSGRPASEPASSASHASRVGGLSMPVSITVPRSRTNAQFNRDTLPEALARRGLGYAHIAELGGLRGKSRQVAPDVNGFWRVPSFHNYADYALGGDFHAGFARLRALGHVQRCAIMCAEAVWWRCHPRIITAHLIVAGESALNLPGRDHIARAPPT